MNDKDWERVDNKLTELDKSSTKKIDNLKRDQEKSFEKHTKALDKRFEVLYNNDQSILDRIIGLTEHVATQNGNVAIALKEAENAKETADKADNNAGKAHDRISGLTLKMLLALIGLLAVGVGAFVTILTHFSK